MTATPTTATSTADAKGANLATARIAKNDEFYTRLVDVEREVDHYADALAGKSVYLNCDDPRRSNFFRYFADRYTDLGLTRLVATGYVADGRGVIVDHSGPTGPGLDALDVRELAGDGSFSSPECAALLAEVDVVVTNPPFSLFRPYLALLADADVDFLVMGSANAATTREVFSLIASDRVWFGHGSCAMDFEVPSGTPGATVRDGAEFKTLGNVCWYTNLPVKRRRLELAATYDPELYPAYDNYDAIEVGKVSAIPVDYDGVMGVPITYLDRHDPARFEIVGLSTTDYPTTKTYPVKQRVVDGEPVTGRSGTLGATLRVDEFGPGVLYDVGYPVRAMYRRIFIRRRQTTNTAQVRP